MVTALPSVLSVPKNLPLVRIVDVDVSVAEIADEQIVAEVAEVGGRLHHAPGGVELALRHEALLQLAIGGVDVDEAEAGALDIVFGVGILLGIADVELAADIGDAERRVAGGESRVGECAGGLRGEGKVFIKHIDLAVVEVGGEEEICAAAYALGDALVDGAVGGGVAGDRVVRVDRGIPAADDARLGGEDEDRRLARSAARDDEIGRGVGELAGGVAAGDVDDAQGGILDERRAVDVAGVEFADAAVVRGDPDRGAGGAERNAPGVLQRWIGERRHARLI